MSSFNSLKKPYQVFMFQAFYDFYFSRKKLLQVVPWRLKLANYFNCHLTVMSIAGGHLKQPTCYLKFLIYTVMRQCFKFIIITNTFTVAYEPDPIVLPRTYPCVSSTVNFRSVLASTPLCTVAVGSVDISPRTLSLALTSGPGISQKNLYYLDLKPRKSHIIMNFAAYLFIP